MTNSDDAEGPRVEVHQAGAARGSGPWGVAFAVTNRSTEPVDLVRAWLPHARFNAEARPLEDEPPLAPEASARLDFIATFDELPGTEAENAFVILQVRWRGELWRVLTRMTVRSGARGEPSARVETVSAHRVGFSARGPR